MSEFFSTIMGVLSSIELTDILDVAIVSFIIYKIIGFLKETRAEQLIKGILIIAFAYIVSYFLDLHVINFLIDILIQNSFIVIVVIFHPEIRKVLEHVGKSKISNFSIFGGNTDDEATRDIAAINGVTEAYKHLQNLKMGALVVFEREIQLNDIVQSGTIVDSNVNSAVVGNIFFNKAPLHDGAVIIRKGRLHSAGCILPLTPQNDIDQNLGTRHRAAIGMSENSDAVVAVLSEETGTMSIAHNGKITPYKSAIEFSTALIELIVPETPTTKDDKKQAVSNFLTKIGKGFKKKDSNRKDGEEDE